jgi:mannan endo-1,4-beta-mannosidase
LEIKKVFGVTSPDSVAIALVTGSSNTWIEATPQSSSSSTLLPFDVKSYNWKSESSSWAYSISVSNVNQVSRIAVLLLSNSANTGALYLVSVRKCQATTVVTASPTASNTLAPSISSPPSSNNKAFVSRSGTSFSWGGCPFYYAGTNNYYMTYQYTFMVTDVLDSAKKMGFNVIRVFSFIDRGSLSSSNVIDSPFYYQYWDTQTNAPAYNDGAIGLERVDFIIAEAAKRGIKLILTFTNNWREFGGMDQYSKWYDLSSHSDFYTDSRVKNAYKSWISHLINRKNTITGKLYKDDPTIFAWELANEPRCKGSGDLGVSSSCNTQTITSWANEMSTYTKSLDENHMVSVGDEGFFNQPGSSDWIYNGSEGVDFDALLALPNIDFGTFHLYPR